MSSLDNKLGFAKKIAVYHECLFTLSNSRVEIGEAVLQLGTLVT